MSGTSPWLIKRISEFIARDPELDRVPVGNVVATVVKRFGGSDEMEIAIDSSLLMLRELVKMDAIDAALAAPKPPPSVKRSKTASRQLLLPLTKR